MASETIVAGPVSPVPIERAGVLRARSVTCAICLVSSASLLSAVTATGVVCSASLVRRAVTTISSRPRALTGRAPSSARVGVAAPVETPVAGGSSEVPEAGAPLCATAGLANARASAEAPADVKNRVRNRDIKLPPLWHGQTAVAAHLYDCHAATCPIDAEVSITCMFEATKR